MQLKKLLFLQNKCCDKVETPVMEIILKNVAGVQLAQFI